MATIATLARGNNFGIPPRFTARIALKEHHIILKWLPVNAKKKVLIKSPQLSALPALHHDISISKLRNVVIAQRGRSLIQKQRNVFALLRSLSKATTPASLASYPNTSIIKIKSAKIAKKISSTTRTCNHVSDAQLINPYLLMTAALLVLHRSTSTFLSRIVKHVLEEETI